MVRIPACHAGGRGFESRPLRQSFRLSFRTVDAATNSRWPAGPEMARLAHPRCHRRHVRFLGWLGSLDFTGVSNTTAAEVDGDRDSRRGSHSRLERHAGALVAAVRHRHSRTSSARRCSRTSSTAWCCASSSNSGSTTQHYRVSDDARCSPNSRTSRSSRVRRQVRLATARVGPAADQQVRSAVLPRDALANCCINQLQQGIGGSYFLTRGEQQRLFNLENEEREVQYAAVRRPTSSPAPSPSTMRPSRPTTTRTAIAS